MLRINALGRLSVVSDAGELTGAAGQPRRLAILALLARAGDRGLQREKLIELLWIDVEADQARRTLAKAIHALRRDLGDEEALVGGATDLRLNPAVITSDVREFGLAIGEGDLARAATLYEGPFLDGFRLPSAPEFERWVEAERDSLARDYELTLERLAAAESAHGNHAAAVRWVRKLAARDPLNARHALRLMQCLSDAGDRVGALHHARVYEALLEQELDVPPDREVVAFARRLREEQPAAPPTTAAAAPPVPNAAPTSPSVAERGSLAAAPAGPAATPNDSLPAQEIGRAPEAAPKATGGGAHTARWLIAAGLVALIVGAAWTSRRLATDASPFDGQVLAVGWISDYRQRATSELARPLADMLATNLARVPELRVLSTARVYELLAGPNAARDTGSAALLAAARRAGASRLVDGALFQLAEGRLRFDLRMVDLSSGSLVVARSVTGVDPFALVDSATALLVAEVGGVAPASSIADVSTRSMVAYRLYEEGLRAFYQNNRRSAQQFFDAAIAEDTTFAMAAYYAAVARIEDFRVAIPLFERALRLVGHTSDRERLTILAHWALITYSPTLGALADTLSVRYPHEVEGHLFSGAAKFKLARYDEAVSALERAVAMDSASLAGVSARCLACDALEYLVRTYRAADDYAGAERVVRRWIRMQPRSTQAWDHLYSLLGLRARNEEAIEALRQRVATFPSVREPVLAVQLHLLTGDLAAAERSLGAYLGTTVDTARLADATWYQVILYRQQGRLRDALDAARRYRALTDRDTVPEHWIAEAQVRLESGEHQRAAAMFDTVSAYDRRARLTANQARSRVWRLAQITTALAAAGDTARLPALADTMRLLGERSGEARDQRLHHYVRGLIHAARRQDDAAAAEFARASSSGTEGYTRINLEIGRTALRRGRPGDAIATLQPALRGLIEGSGYYVTRTELHELLAHAWMAAGGRDSANAHFRVVVESWARADASFAARRDSAARALAGDSRVRRP